MPEPFHGMVNVDIRDSQPDWAPFVLPEAPAGAPNVLYIVLDDIGFAAMSGYGGPIGTPSIERIAPACATRSGTPRLCAHRPGPAC
jgi:hypothetical protein